MDVTSLEAMRSLKEKTSISCEEDIDNDMEEEEEGGGGDGYGDDEKKKKVMGRRGSGSGGGGVSLPCCLVEKCGADLTDAKRYHKRHKVCELHSKAPVVIVSGLRQRFCQQCSRYRILVFLLLSFCYELLFLCLLLEIQTYFDYFQKQYCFYIS